MCPSASSCKLERTSRSSATHHDCPNKPHTRYPGRRALEYKLNILETPRFKIKREHGHETKNPQYELLYEQLRDRNKWLHRELEAAPLPLSNTCNSHSPEVKILVLLKEMTQSSVSFGHLPCRKRVINAGDVFEGLNGYVASHLLTECIVFNWLWSQQKRQPHLIYWTAKGRLLQILGKHQLVLDSSMYNDVLTKGTFIKEDLIAYLTLGTGCLNGKWKYAKHFLFFRGRSKGNRRIKLRIEKPFLLPPFHYG